MTVSYKTNFTGRKAKIGGVCFTEQGRIAFFVGYHPCPNCESMGKVMVSAEEARSFAHKFYDKKQKRIIKKVAVKMLTKLSK